MSSMGVQCEFNACGAIPCGGNGQCLQRNGQACGAMSCERNEFNVSSMPAAQFPAGAIFLHSVSTQ